MANQSYQLKRSRRAHSVRISVDAHGQVIVTAPADCPLHFIDRFVSKHADWIADAQQKIAKRGGGKKVDETKVEIFGKTYAKVIAPAGSGKVGVSIRGSELVVTPVSNTAASATRSLETFLKATAEKYIVPRTHQLAENMKIHFGAITLRQQKTRWGSCSSEGNLNFNWRLIHCPTEVIDYVIIHELAHRKQMNHSSAFWQIVNRYDPEYLKHRGWLKRQAMALS